MTPDHAMVDLAKDLSKKTAKNIRHIAMEVDHFSRLDALAKVRKFIFLI